MTFLPHGTLLVYQLPHLTLPYLNWPNPAFPYSDCITSHEPIIPYLASLQLNLVVDPDC